MDIFAFALYFVAMIAIGIFFFVKSKNQLLLCCPNAGQLPQVVFHLSQPTAV